MKLNKKELKFIKKYPNIYSILNAVATPDYRIINGTPLYRSVGGGSQGYEPDYITIGLTSNGTLGVLNYISKYDVNKLLDQYCPEQFAVELDERLEIVENKLVLPEEQGSVHLDYDDKDHLYAELDTTIANTIANSLQLPKATITTTELVGVNEKKEQQRITIGNGLSIVDNVISAVSGDIPTPPQTGEYVLKSIEGTIQWVEQVPEYKGLKFTAKQENSSVKYMISGTVPEREIQYSYNGFTWHNWTADETISLSLNESIYVRNKSNFLSVSPFSGYVYFVMTGQISASGNVNSMINFAELSTYCYYALFQNCSALTTAPELPATTLAQSCYHSMFKNCSALTTAPELPATTLEYSCYEEMFMNCSSLKVNQNGAGTKIFTCPEIVSSAVDNMFNGTGGEFTGKPTEGNTYNWYK